jgi:hypothetical protein
MQDGRLPILTSLAGERACPNVDPRLCKLTVPPAICHCQFISGTAHLVPAGLRLDLTESPAWGKWRERSHCFSAREEWSTRLRESLARSDERATRDANSAS